METRYCPMCSNRHEVPVGSFLPHHRFTCLHCGYVCCFCDTLTEEQYSQKRKEERAGIEKSDARPITKAKAPIKISETFVINGIEITARYKVDGAENPFVCVLGGNYFDVQDITDEIKDFNNKICALSFARERLKEMIGEKK